MKAIHILGLILTLTTARVYAQGTLDVANNGTGVLIDVGDPGIQGGMPVLIGTPAVAAGFQGAGPGQVSIFFYAAAAGTALSTLETSQNLVGSYFNSSSMLAGAQGTINAGTLTLPTSTAFNGNSPIEIIAFGEAQGGLSAWSAEGKGITPATGTQLPPQIFGTGPGQINSFELISLGPEPSTIAVAAFGAASLLLLRRRSHHPLKR
jgi:hypothetical protein